MTARPSPYRGWQIRAARAAAGLHQSELAAVAGVTARTLKRWEAGDGRIMARPSTVSRVVAALAGRGVTFTVSGVQRKEPTP
jgi:transcriptional regulator with XRE-family HTH domain